MMLQPEAIMDSGSAIPKNEESEIKADIQEELGKDAFFELLITQLRHQDPIDPMDNKDFITQMAQFSSLEQIQNMNDNMEQFLEARDIAENASLIGRNVEITGDEGEVYQGEVKQIVFEEDKVIAKLEDGNRVNIDDIDKIY